MGSMSGMTARLMMICEKNPVMKTSANQTSKPWMSPRSIWMHWAIPLVHAALEEHLPKGDGPDLQHDDAPPDVADGLIPVHGEDEPAGFAVPADGHEEGGKRP